MNALFYCLLFLCTNPTGHSFEKVKKKTSLYQFFVQAMLLPQISKLKPPGLITPEYLCKTELLCLFPFLILPPKSQIKVMEELDTVGHEGTKLEVRRKERNPCSAQALRQACHTFISRKHDCHSWDRSHCPLTKAKTSSHSSPSNLTEFRYPKHEPRTLRLQSSSYIIKQTWACSC